MKKNTLLVITLLIVVSATGCAAANSETHSLSGANATSGLKTVRVSTEAVNLKQLYGVYHYEKNNTSLSGEKYASKNTLEIDPYTDNSVYFRTHLEFNNGHECNLWGIANLSGSALIYDGHIDADGQQCVFTVNISSASIELQDNGVCRTYSCGSRGGYRHIAFERNTRERMQDMDIVKASREYIEAVEEYQSTAASATHK